MIEVPATEASYAAYFLMVDSSAALSKQIALARRSDQPKQVARNASSLRLVQLHEVETYRNLRRTMKPTQLKVLSFDVNRGTLGGIAGGGIVIWRGLQAVLLAVTFIVVPLMWS